VRAAGVYSSRSVRDGGWLPTSPSFRSPSLGSPDDPIPSEAEMGHPARRPTRRPCVVMCDGLRTREGSCGADDAELRALWIGHDGDGAFFVDMDLACICAPVLTYPDSSSLKVVSPEVEVNSGLAHLRPKPRDVAAPRSGPCPRSTADRPREACGRSAQGYADVSSSGCPPSKHAGRWTPTTGGPLSGDRVTSLLADRLMDRADRA
jgi:hypothetical protein